MAYDLAVSEQPAEQAADALLACAPERAAHEVARLRYLRGVSDLPEDAAVQRALGYLEQSIRKGDELGLWISRSPAHS